MKNILFTRNNAKGNVMIITTLLFVAITLSISIGLILPAIGALSVAKNTVKSKTVYALAESGIEDTYYRLFTNKNVATTSTLSLAGVSTTTVLSDISSTQKQIKSTAIASNFTRIASAIAAKAATVSLPFGVLVGSGGLSMQGGQVITGDVYANGPITVSGSSATITGSATSVVSITGDDQWRPINVGTNGNKNAWAPIVSKASVSGILYCNSGSLNNKACNTTQGTPTVQPMPIDTDAITGWKNAASATIIQGNVSYVGSSNTSVISARKIVGNLTIDNGYNVNLTGPLWITGNLTMGNGVLRVDPSYAGGSIAIIVDGRASIANGATITGSGTAGSYAVLIVTSDCPASAFCGGNPAISAQGGGGSVALIAQNGTIRISSNSGSQHATGNRVELQGGVSLTYNAALNNLTFSSGTGWGITSWQETSQ